MEFKRIIESMEYNELLGIKKELDKGGIEIKRIVKERIKEEQRKHAEYCGTCSNKLDLRNVNNFTLVFGPDDFRKKASFCGIDCLEYFLAELKEIKRG